MIETTDAGLGELAFSLKPPKAIRKAVGKVASAVGRVVKVAAPILALTPLATVGIAAGVAKAARVVGKARGVSRVTSSAKRLADSSRVMGAVRNVVSVGRSVAAVSAAVATPRTNVSPVLRGKSRRMPSQSERLAETARRMRSAKPSGTSTPSPAAEVIAPNLPAAAEAAKPVAFEQLVQGAPAMSLPVPSSAPGAGDAAAPDDAPAKGAAFPVVPVLIGAGLLLVVSARKGK